MSFSDYYKHIHYKQYCEDYKWGDEVVHFTQNCLSYLHNIFIMNRKREKETENKKYQERPDFEA